VLVLEGPDAAVEWAAWFERAWPGRRVAETLVRLRGREEPVRVSTVFIGVNHQWHPDAPAQWFETMVFGLDDDRCRRYATWEGAEAGHAAVVAQLREERGGDAD
jgi:hypothetical protein